MNFDKLLESLETEGQEKTAAAQQPLSPNTALKTALQKTLDKSASAPAQTPPTSNPVDDLEKLAESLAETEKEAEIIQAANMGRAFADALLDQVSAADAKLAQVQAQIPAPQVAPAVQPTQAEVDNAVKLAAEQGYADAQNAITEALFTEKVANAQTVEEQADLIKVAQEAGREDLLVKAAAEQGYKDAQEKIAETQYAQGEEDALKEVHDLAAGEFLKGAQEVQVLVEKARQQQAV